MKEGIDISFVLTEEQQAAGLKLKTINGKKLTLYRGKQELTSMVVRFKNNTVRTDIIQGVADQYKEQAKLLKEEEK